MRKRGTIACPACFQQGNRIFDSRGTGSGVSDVFTQVRRRRRCLACGYRFTTYEQYAELDIQQQRAPLRALVDQIEGLVRRLKDLSQQ